MTRLVVVALVLAAIAHVHAAPDTHQVKLNGHTFTLPKGFTIELAAKTPLVDRPIVATFDDRGRLYVADSSGSNEKPDFQLKNPTHRIMRLEDTKGTGVFDKATVFADKMMFPEGILWHRGSVYVGAPPHIWKLTDTDDDGKADKRDIWFDGKTLTGCANDLHGPYLGPDGWIYWCKGAFAKQEYTLPNGKKLTTRAAHIFRARPDGTGIEPVMTGGMDNPVDVAFLPNGERFFTTTFFQHPANGQRDGIVHAIYGGIYGKDHDVIYDKDHKWTSPNTMPVMTHLGPAAPCGLHCYESAAFGPDYKSNLFCCQFNLRKVSRHVLKPSGSTYTTEDSDFVVSDNQDFHPTDVIEDADGSLLIVDTGGWYKLCCPSSQLVKEDVLGAIYRVRKDGAKKPKNVWGNDYDWSKEGIPELVYNLKADAATPALHHRVVEHLAVFGDKAIANMTYWVFKDSDAVTEPTWIRAMAVASRIDSPAARKFIRDAISEAETTEFWANGHRFRQAVIHTMGLHRDREAVPILLKMLDDKNAVTRRMAVEALGRIGDAAAVPPILKALEAKDIDRTLEHALTYALIEIGNARMLADRLDETKAVQVRRAMLTAIDQIWTKETTPERTSLNPATIIAELGSEDKAIYQMAVWIIGRHPEWADDIAKAVREQLMPEMVPVLAKMIRVPAIEKGVQDLLASEDRHEKMLACRVLAVAHLKEVQQSWLDALGKLVNDATDLDGELSYVSLQTLRALSQGGKLPRSEILERQLRAIYSRDTLSSKRLTAMSVYPGGMSAFTDEEYRFVLKSLDRVQPAEERGLVAEVLSKAKLTHAQLNALVATLPKVGPLELDRVLTAFAQTKDKAVGLKLVAALDTPELRPSLRVDGVKERIKHFPMTVHKAAEKLYSALNAEYEQQRAKLDEMTKTLTAGDVRRGQAVFNSAKASCLACHTIGYVGGKIGPDLTRIGGIRTERDLLESILFPSASFVRSYEPLLVTLKDGRSFTGAPKKDAPDEIVLVLAADKEQRIAREDIEEVRPGKVSVMPAGLDKQITPQELADLIAFLRACK